MNVYMDRTMPTKLDHKMLTGFTQEAQSYLPTIRAGLESFLHEAHQNEALEAAYQHVHAIKGAAEMLELVVLSQVTSYIQEMLGEIVSQPRQVEPTRGTCLRHAINHLEQYLAHWLSDDSRAQVCVSEIAKAFHSFKGLSAAGDQAAVAEVCSAPQVLAEPTASANVALSAETSAPVLQDHATAPRLDEVSSELIDGFFLEAEEHLNVVGRLLPGLSHTPAEHDHVQQVRRSIHTFKGAAGVVGFRSASRLAHCMEDLLDELYEGSRPLTVQIKDHLLATFDALDEFVRTRGQCGTFDQTAQALAQAYTVIREEAPAEVVVPPEVEPQPAAGPTPSVCGTVEVAAVPGTIPEPQTPPQQDTAVAITPVSGVLRVPLERVDELVRLVSELVISRSAYEQHLGRLTCQVDELRLSIERLRRATTTVETQYEVRSLVDHQSMPANQAPVTRVGARSATSGSALEFDALEFDRYSELTLVARELTETSADIGALGQEFGDILGDFDSYLSRQARLTSEIQDRLMQLRMVPLATLATRLQRAVRVTARQRGKEAELVLEGEEVAFDKTMLEAMAEPLLHMLRNAVDHGIEAPEQRQALGKPPQRKIHLRAFREGSQVVLQMHDDGAGLDLQRLRATAVRADSLSEEDAARLTHEQLYALIFRPGLSTAQEVSEVSGRGVGMDVVQTTVKRLKGQLSIDSTPGQGVTFTIRLPLTLAITRVFMVKANGQTFAIPFADVTQIVRLAPEAITCVGDTPVISINEQAVPVIRLSERLCLPATPESPVRLLPMVVTQAGDSQVAFVVDQLLGGREVVVKPLGSHLRRVQGVIGCTVMGDGSVVLILNPRELARPGHQHMTAQQATVKPQSTQSSEVFEVLIVDDSFSVRQVVSNLIKSAGWHPVLARDGLEAFEIIQRSAAPPALILLDVEMPRMDGYELTSTLRGHAAYRDIPIIMLTSRAGEKHRHKAFEVGATEYLVKPYQDETLLSVIRQHMPPAGRVMAA
jgi:chemosensory pili system protein ChpA (sensor histidine kinase/response regulator)